jgi:cytochrome b6
MGGGEGRSKATERCLLIVSLVDLVVLGVTGAWLVFGYRPTVAAGHPIGASNASSVDWFRFVHRWSANALVALGLGWLLLALIRLAGERLRISRIVTAAAILVLAVGGWISGWLLPWDQLALWSVNVGENLAGYGMLLDDDRVRFLLIGGTEVSLGSLRVALAAHAVAIPLAILVLYLSAGLRSRRSPREGMVELDAAG